MKLHRRLRAMELALVAAALYFSLPNLTQADDWPQFLGPHRNGVSDWKGPVTAWNAQGPKVRWRTAVGAGFSGPVAEGDALILFHQPGEEEVVECFDLATGKSRWKTGYPCDYQGGYGSGPGPRATPCISGGRVVSFGVVGVLQCVELGTGKVLWRRDLAKEYTLPDNFFGIGSSPLVDDGKIFLNLGCKKKAGLAAFDLQTGKTLWTSTDDEASYSSPVMAEMHGERLAFFFARSGLHCVDAKSGTEHFFFPFRARMHASVNAATPVIDGDQVFITSSYGVGATLLQVQPGEKFAKIWLDQDVMSSQYNTPVLHDGFLYGIDGREDIGVARLVCLALKSGKLQWAEENFGCASVVLVGKQLILLTQDGDLVLAAANPRKFELMARAKVLTSPCRAQPAVANRQLFARDEKELFSLELTR